MLQPLSPFLSGFGLAYQEPGLLIGASPLSALDFGSCISFLGTVWILRCEPSLVLCSFLKGKREHPGEGLVVARAGLVVADP